MTMAKKTEPAAVRLIAVEGTRAKDIAAGAAAVTKKLETGRRRCAVSLWDASGTFGDVATAKRRNLALSPRSIVLLYAADLAFRLRWEIGPAIDRGDRIVAAPYLATVFAWGEAAGIPRDWLREVFRFAPNPDAAFRVEERKKKAAWNRKAPRGLGEFGAAAGIVPDAEGHRRRMIERLDRAEARKEVAALTRPALKDLEKAAG
jgi:thymidylate kinase